jgi:hypothetical protein
MIQPLHRALGLTTAAVLTTATVMPSSAEAQRRQAEPPLQVSYVTDAGLTCEQLTAEITRMEEIAGISAQNARNAENQGAMATGATSVAVNAALYSGALGAVPGLGLFANFAGQAARRNAEARARAEAERIRVAQQRHSLLTGIYQGRQCGAPAPAVVTTASETSAAPASAPAEGVPGGETDAGAPAAPASGSAVGAVPATVAPDPLETSAAPAGTQGEVE